MRPATEDARAGRNAAIGRGGGDGWGEFLESLPWRLSGVPADVVRLVRSRSTQRTAGFDGGVGVCRWGTGLMVKIRCSCGNRVELPEGNLGKAGACSKCKRVIRVVAPGYSAGDDSLRGKLLVHNGPHRLGEQIFLGGKLPIEVGKLPGNDIRLQGTHVSRTHCRLVPSDSGWRVEDANSANGVRVNGRRVDTHDLRHGDRIRIGDFELKYFGPSEVRRSPADRAATSGTPKRGAQKPVAPPPRETLPAAPLDAIPVSPSDVEPDDADGYAIADSEVDELYELAAAGEEVAVAPVADLAAGGRVPAQATGDGPVCPSCEKQLPSGARICVACGINAKTGRAILTSQDHSLDQTYMAAESVIRVISWVVPFAFSPIGSEAIGTRKPYLMRGLAIITVLVSSWFLVHEWTRSPQMQSLKNLMLWPKAAEPEADHLWLLYHFTSYGDTDALNKAEERLRRENPRLTEDELLLAAHNSLSPEKRCIGEYRSSQLITHAFLHGGIGHLLGNLVFLIVFGSRVNALIGHVGTLILYPVLAIGAAITYLTVNAEGSTLPMVGASGAIMGLAGMYFVFFPVHKVHMAIWLRWGFIGGFRLSLKMWAVRGFWVVLFYIAFDVFFTSMGIETGTAHWAHLGGFLFGLGFGLLLLFTRLVNCRGGDIVSAMLSKHAWSLVGRPHRELGLLQRLP